MKRNTSLQSKPKVFFIQACRGNTKMTADDGPPPPPLTRSSSNIVLSRFYDDKNRLPKRSRLSLLVFDFGRPRVVARDEDDDGSWYIQMLCKAIREEKTREISAILRYTHSLISQMVGTASVKHTEQKNECVEIKMTPTYEDRLTKLFYIAQPQQVFTFRMIYCAAPSLIHDNNRCDN